MPVAVDANSLPRRDGVNLPVPRAELAVAEGGELHPGGRVRNKKLLCSLASIVQVIVKLN